MKKLIIILIIAAVACTSVFAGNLSLGFSQGLINTSFVADYEWENFGVHGDIGFPLVYTAIAGINSAKAKASGEEEKQITFLDYVLPGAHAGVYWKALDGKHLALNVGLGGTFQSYFMKEKFRMFGAATITGGFKFKFNERFSIGLDSSLPLAVLLSPISDDLAKYTFFLYQEGGGEPGDIFAIFFGVIYYGINDLARLTFRWTI